jgi:hypothetical protein
MQRYLLGVLRCVLSEGSRNDTGGLVARGELARNGCNCICNGLRVESDLSRLGCVEGSPCSDKSSAAFTYRSSAVTSSAQEQVVSRQVSKFWPSATLLPFDIN